MQVGRELKQQFLIPSFECVRYVPVAICKRGVMYTFQGNLRNGDWSQQMQNIINKNRFLIILLSSVHCEVAREPCSIAQRAECCGFNSTHAAFVLKQGVCPFALHFPHFHVYIVHTKSVDTNALSWSKCTFSLVFILSLCKRKPIPQVLIST